MPYYQSIKGRKYEYADEQPAGFKPIAPGKFPLMLAGDFGDIVGNEFAIVVKPHARLLKLDKTASESWGNMLRSFLSKIKPGDLLQPVKIVRDNADPRHPLSTTDYFVTFDNGVSLMAKDLEAVLNHPSMTIHGINGESRNVALMVDGEVVGVVAGGIYSPKHSVILWEAPQP